MMRFSKWLSATLASILMVAAAAGADATIASGKVKSVNADSATFVLTDAADKDVTFKFGDALIFNRGGKEGKNDLKSGDAINICCDKGQSTPTAHYILVQEGTTKNSILIRGSCQELRRREERVDVHE